MCLQETYAHATKVNLERQRQLRVGLGVGSGSGAGRAAADFSKSFGYSTTSLRDTVLVHEQLK